MASSITYSRSSETSKLRRKTRYSSDEKIVYRLVKIALR